MKVSFKVKRLVGLGLIISGIISLVVLWFIGSILMPYSASTLNFDLFTVFSITYGVGAIIGGYTLVASGKAN